MFLRDGKKNSRGAWDRLSALAPLLLCQQPATARLGEDFEAFQARIVSNFTFKGQDSKSNRTYYHYTMLLIERRRNRPRDLMAG